MRKFILCPALVVCLVGLSRADTTDVTYTFREIGYPGSDRSTAYSINNQRDIVGSYQYDPRGPVHSFLLHEATYSNIDVPGAYSTWATGINNKGTIVGYYITVDPHTCYFDCGGHAFLRDDERHYQTIDPPGAAGAAAFAINNRGQVVGDWSTKTFQTKHFLYTKGTFIPVNDPPNSFANLQSVNNAGDMLFDNTLVGKWLTSILVFPGAIFTRGRSINDLGQVAGFYKTQGGINCGFVYSRGGTFQSVAMPGTTSIGILGINNNGDIVGSINDYEAFVGIRN